MGHRARVTWVAAGVLLLMVVSSDRTDLRAATPARAERQAAADAGPGDASASSRRALLDGYCVSCHSERLKAGDLVLEDLNAAVVGPNAELWERLVRKLRSGAMPPAGLPRPDEGAMGVFVTSLETALDQAAAAAPDPGRPVAHRLNRVEYTNAIRDLLHLEIDGDALLPADDAGFGFDNIGDVLTITPGLLERYLIAAQRISRLAVGDPTLPVSVEQYDVPYLLLRQDGRMHEDLPFGTRGGLVFSHTFPVDGEYIVKVRLQRNAISLGAALRGVHVESLLDVRIDGHRVQRFSVGKTHEAGDAVSSVVGATELEQDGDSHLDVRLSLKAGPRRIGITFQNANWEFEGVGPSRLPVASYGHAAGKVEGNGGFGRIQAGIDNVQIVGPMNGLRPTDTPARERVFVCQPTSASDEEACARRISAALARRAYRRPSTSGDVDTLLEFYRSARAKGDFEAGIQAVVKRVLADPEFLVRIEAQSPGANAVYPITDLELASRLSFFLWSSIPDDELLDVAAGGRLRAPGVLEQQVRRMLADDRSNELVTNFFGQWLWVRNMAELRPDRFQFPDFDENLREAFQRETELFLESQLREDRPITDLLTANYTFVNERLARHYGLPGVVGSHFRRVTLPGDRRGGILGHGSVLTVTSYANRTSPVVRGKWVLENLLNTPPPVPPANVPPFPDGEAVASLSVRQRMEQHRKNPVCAACHSRLDPLGFALENFDAIGRWREQDAASVIDPSGMFPDGAKFDGPAAFRAGLLDHRDAFIATVTEKMLTYALGRGAEYYDMPTVRDIGREIAERDYRWTSLVMGIVNSAPFQMRRKS
jgi:mono/diheme cytochrome c family protein